MSTTAIESPGAFLDTLKTAGVEIINEREVRERLGEVQRWRDAFTTLARNGRTLGILFKSRDNNPNMAAIHRAFAEFKFPAQSEAQFSDSLNASH